MKEILVADDGGHILNQLQNNFAAAFLLAAVFGRNNVALGGVEASGSRSMERALPVPILPSAGTAGASATTKIQLLECSIPPPAPLYTRNSHISPNEPSRVPHEYKEPKIPKWIFSDGRTRDGGWWTEDGGIFCYSSGWHNSTVMQTSPSP